MNLWRFAVIAGVFVGNGLLAVREDCPGTLAEQVEARQWRQPTSHPDAQGEFAATNSLREGRIEQTSADMEAFIFDHTDVPEMEFYAAAGVKVKHVRTWQSNQMPAIEVSGLGKEGILRGTLLLPVSGHCGAEKARAWATTDTYKVFLEGGSKQVLLVKDAKSLGFVTKQELQIPLEKGKALKITYHRSGSGGPGGFPGGRILEITWDGT